MPARLLLWYNEDMFHKYKLENLIVIPRIVTIHYLELDKSFGYEGECHDFWEMVYADSEEIGIRAGDKTFILQEGQAVFHKPNEFHSLSALEKPANVFIASFDCNSEAMRFFSEKVVSVPPELKKLIASILNEARQTFLLRPDKPFIKRMEKLPSPPLGSLQLIRLYLECLLIHILREENNQTRPLFVPESEYGNNILKEIEQCLQSMIFEGFSLTRLCKRIGISKTRLYDFYRQQTGKTVGQRFSQLRLEEAKRLLRKTGHVGITADTLGFSSEGYFIHFFKKYTGMTPKSYLKGVAAAADSFTE